MRTIIIGDIHGCARTFDALLAELGADSQQDRLILLGDLFDRGPESWEVWQKVRALEAEYGDRFVLLCGNHEDYWLCEHPTLSQRILHERVGRRATVQSFKRHQANMEECLQWLQQHVQLCYVEDSFQCVHAGLNVSPPELNDRYTLMHDHDVVLRNEYNGLLTITGHIGLEEPLWFAGDGEHVQTLKVGEVQELPAQGIICIDTGCGKGGALTGMTIQDGHYCLISIP